MAISLDGWSFLASKDLIMEIVSVCSVYYRIILLDYVESQSPAGWPRLKVRQQAPQHIVRGIVDRRTKRNRVFMRQRAINS